MARVAGSFASAFGGNFAPYLSFWSQTDERPRRPQRTPHAACSPQQPQPQPQKKLDQDSLKAAIGRHDLLEN